MADLNEMMAVVVTLGSTLKRDLTGLLVKYDELYRQSNKVLMDEQSESDGSMAGLEEFYRMVQTVRRNRDVVGSMVRGFANIRPLEQFQIIEEEPEKPKQDPKVLKSRIEGLRNRLGEVLSQENPNLGLVDGLETEINRLEAQLLAIEKPNEDELKEKLASLKERLSDEAKADNPDEELMVGLQVDITRIEDLLASLGQAVNQEPEETNA